MRKHDVQLTFTLPAEATDLKCKIQAAKNMLGMQDPYDFEGQLSKIEAILVQNSAELIANQINEIENEKPEEPKPTQGFNSRALPGTIKR